jgi:hypothetical protein
VTHDPAHIESFAPPVLKWQSAQQQAAEIDWDKVARDAQQATPEQLEAFGVYRSLQGAWHWPPIEQVVQPEQPCGLGYVAFNVIGYACAVAACGMLFFAMVAS